MTKTSIGRRIGRLWILEKYLVKLPKTNNIVNSLVESHEEYQIRRMKWAARILFEEGVSLTMSKIVKKAGLFRVILKMFQKQLVMKSKISSVK